jgi:hypothetical protein
VKRIDLVAAGHPVHSIVVVDGREVRSPVSSQTLGRALAAAHYEYKVVDLPRAPTLSHSGRTLHLIVEAVRALLAQHEPAAIAAAFPHTNDPRLVRAVPAVVDALGMQGPHARMIKLSLAGDDTVEGAAKNAAGARVAWDALVLLELFGGLSFAAGIARTRTPAAMMSSLAPTPSMPSTSTPPPSPRDHFLALGLHWSAIGEEVAAAVVKARGAARHSGDTAALAVVDAAAVVLLDETSRVAYRRRTFQRQWSNEAALLLEQAKLALYRKEVVEARRLLLAAQELSPSDEAAKLLVALRR